MSREMKHSGIEWIGEIPKEWVPARFKYSGSFIKGKLPATQNNENKGLPVIGASEMLGKEPRLYTEDFNIPTCSEEDILILWDGANAGIIANNCKGIVSSTAVKYSCTDKRFNKQYMFYLLKNAEPFFKSKVGGTTIPHMNARYIDEYLCILPPLPEQQKIADYLDKVCGEVDDLVVLQEQMIEELKAYKQSVITESVTKGLNPHVPMRDSGIDWIGEIPEHWEAKKLKYIVDYIESGTSVNAGNVPAQANEYGVLKTSAVSKYVFDATENKTVVSEEMDKVSCPVRKNTIIVSRMNTPELVGACGYVEKNYDTIFLPDRLWQVHFVDTVYVKYIWYALRGSNIRNYYSSLSVGSSSSMQNISQSQFSNGSIPIPNDVEEQCAITSYLDTKCSEIDSLIDLKQAKIEELKEYKKSVIYEYVTGKKEVI